MKDTLQLWYLSFDELLWKKIVMCMFNKHWKILFEQMLLWPNYKDNIEKMLFEHMFYGQVQ